MNLTLKIFTALLFFSGFLFGQEKCSDAVGEEFLNRANSMYWLSRARQNALPEAQKAYFYLHSAEVYIKKKKMIPACKKEYLQRIEIFRNELDELIEVTTDNLNGIFPIIPFLTNQYDQFEYYDEAIETSLEKALSNLIESGIYKPANNLKEVLLFCVIDTDEQSLKEVASQYLNNKSRMYVISDHEIKQALGENSVINDSSLARLGEFYATNYIGKLVISEYENSENVAYTGVRFEFYNLSNSELISNTYAEGMKVDMRGRSLQFFKLFGFFILIGFGIASFGYFLIQKQTKKSIEFKSFLISTIAGLTLSICASLLVFLLFSTFAPKGEEFMGEPQVFTFPYLISTVLILSPLLLFILSGLLLKRMLSDQQGLIFTFFFMALLAITFPVKKAASVYLQLPLPLFAEFGYLLSCFLVAYFSSLYLAIQYRKNKGIAWILLSFFFFIPLVFALTELMKIGNEISETLIFVSGISTLATGVVYLAIKRKKIKEDREVRKTLIGSSEEKLKEFINSLLTNQSNSKHVPFNKDHECFLTESIYNFKGFKHLHLSGSSGIGKTTLIKAVLDAKKDELYSFYGDCDEIQEGSTIPYEPFYQAFSEHLGEGIFFNGSIAAVDLLQKAKPVLNLAGVGELTEHINSNSAGFSGASVKEILKNILGYLNKLTTTSGKRRIVFVIEDLHWVDNHTQELLKEAIRELFIITKKQKGPLDVCFITTSSGGSDGMADIIGFSKKLFENESEYKYVEWTNSEKENLNLDQLTSKSFVKELLSPEFSGVLFARNAVLEILDFVDRADTIKPRYVLELIKHLLEKEYLLSVNGVLELDKELDWDSIPFESELEELYHEKFTSLPIDVLKVLESAAFVGMEFEADLLSKLWKIDRINLIHNLLKAEKLGIVVDINDHDDYYRFGSKAVRAAMKRFSLTNQNSNGKIPQIIKEYHKEIIAITLERYNDDSEFLDKVPDELVLSLAERAMLVYRDYPVKAKQIVLSATKRSVFVGDLSVLKEYLKFIFLMSEESLVGNNLYWDIFLRANLLQLSSNPSEYEKEFGAVLIQIIIDKILREEGSDLELKCFYELILKISRKDKRLFKVLSKYNDHPYSRLYTILIDKENHESKRFSQEQLEILNNLQIEFSTMDGLSDLKQQLLGILALASSGAEQLKYLLARINLIFPEINDDASLSEQLDFIDENWKKLDFDSIQNCGFLLGGLNGYLKSKDDKALIFKLNKIRLSLNERLNHRLGIFLASLELLNCFDQWTFDEYNEFAEHLYYTYEEGSFRAQVYPYWLSRVISEDESLDKIEVITLSLLGQLKNPRFLTENEKKYVRLPREKYLELLQSENLNDGNEKEILRLLLDFCPV